MREYGAAVCETEMVSAKGLAFNSRGTRHLLATRADDAPLVVQLFGAETSYLANAVEMLREDGFVWFDLNMGCSVPKVMRQGAGAAMLGDPEHILEVAKAMLDRAGAGLVGFKLRLGLGPEKPIPGGLISLALRLQELGAGWICLHPRYASQGFSGTADWDFLAMMAEKLSIPLIASGDLFTATDGVRCLSQTGANCVMYARGALRNPAIFADHAAIVSGREPAQPEPATLERLVRRHVGLWREYFAMQNVADDSCVWKMRSVIPRYVHALPGVKALRTRICQCLSWQDLDEVLDSFFAGKALD